MNILVKKIICVMMAFVAILTLASCKKDVKNENVLTEKNTIEIIQKSLKENDLNTFVKYTVNDKAKKVNDLISMVPEGDQPIKTILSTLDFQIIELIEIDEDKSMVKLEIENFDYSNIFTSNLRNVSLLYLDKKIDSSNDIEIQKIINSFNKELKSVDKKEKMTYEVSLAINKQSNDKYEVIFDDDTMNAIFGGNLQDLIDIYIVLSE